MNFSKPSSVRIVSLTLEDYKNVLHGTLSFINANQNYSASVLGLYGQNGSGKTSVINSLWLLKHILSGFPVPDQFTNSINVDAKNARLQFVFDMHFEGGNEFLRVWYEFKLGVAMIPMATGENSLAIQNSRKPFVYDERIDIQTRTSDTTDRKLCFFNTASDDAFAPKSRYQVFVGRSSKLKNQLLVAKQVARQTSRSFLMDEALGQTLQTRKLEVGESVNRADFGIASFVLHRLKQYAQSELFVVTTREAGMISLTNTLPLGLKYEQGSTMAYGTFLISLGSPDASPVPERTYPMLEKAVNTMNIVLRHLIPGLIIEMVPMGKRLLNNNEKGILVQFLSNRDGKKVPFCYESEGIKKIVSILHLLIAFYNKDSITVAVDELDSGIFEYLLGELLKIISERGKGQLIFTSHNLRILETIDKGFIAFTTTDSKNRFERLRNVKGTNNLRDVYFRNIVLGKDSEHFYQSTNNARIDLALQQAGSVE